jgi:hypothetical protein
VYPVRLRRGLGGVGVGAGAQKPAFWRKAGSAEATWPLAESWRHAGGCPRTPKSAMESHLGFAESSRVHEPLPTSQFAAVAALPPRNNSLRYSLGQGESLAWPFSARGESPTYRLTPSTCCFARIGQPSGWGRTTVGPLSAFRAARTSARRGLSGGGSPRTRQVLGGY